MYLYFIRTFNILIIFSICFLLGCSENRRPEKRALELVVDSYALDEDKPVYRFIKEFLNQKGDDVKPIGWYVEKTSDSEFLVSYKYRIYSFKEGIGEKGFFFEVNLNNESVIDRTNEYLEKMKPLSKTYKISSSLL